MSNIYYSYYHRLGEKSQNQHQLELEFYEKNGKLIQRSASPLIVDRLFIIKLWKTRIALLEEYLDFHFNKYNGEKINFLRHSEEIIHKEIKRRNSFHSRDRHILKWIEKKEQEFEKIKNTVQQIISKKSSNTSSEAESNPEYFKDIFSGENWKTYIIALEKTEPPLISKKWEFIGMPKNHKGVVCSWIRHLQNKSIIKQKFTRSELARVVNNEIKNFNLGKDGKTFDNVSDLYTKKFKVQLLELIK